MLHYDDIEIKCNGEVNERNAWSLQLVKKTSTCKSEFASSGLRFYWNERIGTIFILYEFIVKCAFSFTRIIGDMHISLEFIFDLNLINKNVNSKIPINLSNPINNKNLIK